MTRLCLMAEFSAPNIRYVAIVSAQPLSWTVLWKVQWFGFPISPHFSWLWPQKFKSKFSHLYSTLWFIKEFHGPLLKNMGMRVKSIELASQFSYLLTLWCWTSHSSLLSIGFLIYAVGIIMGTPALLTSQGFLQGGAGQWGPDNHQRLSLHLGYLVFHNFSAHSSLVRRLVGWRFPCFKDQGTENVF